MATEIAEAFVQIKPTTKGIKNELTKQMGGEVSSAGDSAGESFGKSMVSKLKGIVAAAGIGAIVKSALDAGGAVQQSFGGLDTLYGDASEAAKAYAKEAVSAGISMNDYAEQAVSFGAGLKAAFGGDTAKAVEAANTAILDMADNAAKMGTPLESIQNAYQGFAKGNYTMLDNLKLGFGGTRSEMERLLKTAENSPKNVLGKSFDINNLGDVYEAIHIIQEDLDLTGVAAQEASETFSGSMGAMKAAATNFLADLSLGNDVSASLGTLIQSTMTFVEKNLLPMIANIIKAIPSVLGTISSEISFKLNELANGLDFSAMFDAGVQFVNELVSGLISNIPYLIVNAISLVSKFANALITYNWADAARNLIQSLSDELTSFAEEAFDAGEGEGFLKPLFDSVLNMIPDIMELGGDLLLGLVDGITSAIPSLLEGTATMLTSWWDALADALPTIFDKGVEILTKLIDGIIDALPKLIETALKVIVELVNNIGKNLPKILQAGIELLGKLAEGIIKAIPKLVAMLPQVFTAIVNAFKNVDWKEIGHNIMEGIKNGIINAVKGVVKAAKDAAGEILDSVKGFLGIHSPSRVFRDQVGAMIPEGMAIGIEANTDAVKNAMSELSKATVSTGVNGINYAYNVGGADLANDVSGIDRVIGLLNEYLPILGNQQIMLDGNILVGATASRMDSELGRIAERSGRGVVFA